MKMSSESWRVKPFQGLVAASVKGLGFDPAAVLADVADVDGQVRSDPPTSIVVVVAWPGVSRSGVSRQVKPSSRSVARPMRTTRPEPLPEPP